MEQSALDGAIVAGVLFGGRPRPLHFVIPKRLLRGHLGRALALVTSIALGGVWLADRAWCEWGRGSIRHHPLAMQNAAHVARGYDPQVNGKLGPLIAQVDFARIPRVSEMPPTPAEIRRIQEKLLDLGHQPGPIDGILGARTRSALRAFQQASRLPADGSLTRETLSTLQQTEIARRPSEPIVEARERRPMRFRKGSTRSRVIEVQGGPWFTQPDYSKGVERLWYGRCYVEISLDSGKVVDWHQPEHDPNCDLKAMR